MSLLRDGVCQLTYLTLQLLFSGAEKLWEVIGAKEDNSNGGGGGAGAAAAEEVCLPCPDPPETPDKAKEAAAAAAEKAAAAETAAAAEKAAEEERAAAEAAIKAEKRIAKEERAARKAAKAEKKARAKEEAAKAKDCGAVGHDDTIAHITDLDGFHALIKQPKPVIIDFTASWCGPCQMFAPTFTSLSTEYPLITFVKCDVDEAEDVAEECGVTAMPTFQLFVGGGQTKCAGEVCGVDEASLRKLLEKHGGSSCSGVGNGGEAAAAADKKAEKKAEKKRKREEAAAAETDAGTKLGHGGRRMKGAPQPVIDTSTKPIKWKKIIQKELQTEGGTMGLKALRKACVAEARAHPSYCGREKAVLQAEFDEVLPTFNKFKVNNNMVTVAAGE